MSSTVEEFRKQRMEFGEMYGLTASVKLVQQSPCLRAAHHVSLVSTTISNQQKTESDLVPDKIMLARNTNLIQ